MNKVKTAIAELPNLLIVDDYKENLFLLEILIKKINVNLITANSGSEALAKTKGIELALAIIDVRMPAMNGYELAMKMNERTNDKVPVIFLTASHFNELEMFKGYGFGAVDYIFKPIDNNFLLSKINVFLDLYNKKRTIIREAETLKKYADELTRVNYALKESEERYRSYIDNAPDGVFVSDENGRYIEVNKAGCRITGYSREELLRMSISDLLSKGSFDEGAEQLKNTIASGGSRGDLLFRHSNGTDRWWSVEAVKLSDTRLLGFTKDITVRKELENNLKTYQNDLENQNEELTQAKNQAEVALRKYSELFDLAPSGYFAISSTGSILDLNLSGAAMLGEERSLLIENNFNQFISKSSLPVFDSFFRKVFESKTKEICELKLKSDSMQSKYVHIEGMIIGDGRQCLINVVDITSRKLAERTLEISEKKYRTMLNASPDGIVLIDLVGIITEVSEIGLELFGADKRDDMVSKNISQFVPEEDNTTIFEMIEKTMNEGLTQNIGLTFKKKNQNLFPGELSATLIQSSDGAPLSFMIIIRDISQRKKAETKQIHADRMVNLGEMASGIAHEINQPLNIISLVLDKILFESDKTNSVDIDFLKDKSDKIFENIIRIRNIIDHIRAFSRSHDDYVLAAFSINTSIENGVSMISEQFKHMGIALDLKLEKQTPQIVGNTYKFEQVIVNLLANARDAVMEKKCKIPGYSQMLVGIKSYQEDQSIVVEVTDNGIGIPDDDLNNVILPFYTTKDEGKGTGLGLSICYQIMKEMGGTIEIISSRKTGTKIKLNMAIQKKK